MEQQKNNTLITLLIIAGIILLVFGVLYGWFRRRERLSKEYRIILDSLNNQIIQSQTINQEEAKKKFSDLWNEHVRLTREVIISQFSNNPILDSKVKELLYNQVKIGNTIDMYYPGSGAVITKLLQEHISQAKDILDDLKYKRLERLSADINKWFSNGDVFAEAMNRINPKWKLKAHMQEHLRITEREAIYQWIGAKDLSKQIYNERIVPNAQQMANIISENLK